MGAQLRGVEVYFSYQDERFHIHIPAALSPIIGKHGVLRCRLDGVRRRGSPEVGLREETFESSFGVDRQLVIPSRLANHCGISGGSALDLTILERLNLKRGFLLRLPKYSPIYPNDTVIFDHGDGASSHFSGPSGEGVQSRLSPRQLVRTIQQDLVKPGAAVMSPAAAPPAPANVQARSDGEATDRRRRPESLDPRLVAKASIAVEKMRGLGIVPPEQLVRQARGG